MSDMYNQGSLEDDTTHEWSIDTSVSRFMWFLSNRRDGIGVTDAYSRYPENDIVKSTSAEASF